VRKMKKKKVAKIKKNASEEEVAVAIARHTEAKAKEVDRQTAMMEAKQAQEEKRIKQEQTELVLSKNRITFYKAQRERLHKNINEIREEFLAQVQELRQLEGVQEVAIDSEGRIIITTTPLSVDKEGWNEPKVAGQYSIRIDFSQPTISRGIRVLNITQRFADYDSPTINNTGCCWGNIEKDVSRDFYTQNLLELVGDMMEYCVSPFESHGYIGQNGDKHKGWEQFFEKATPQPANYTWEAYDRENPENEGEDYPARAPQLERAPGDRIEGALVEQYMGGGGGAPGMLQSYGGGGGMLQPQSVTAVEMNQQTLRAYEQENMRLRERLAEADPSPRDQYEDSVWRSLSEIGLTDQAVKNVFRDIWRESHGDARELRLERTTIGAGAPAIALIVDVAAPGDRTHATIPPRYLSFSEINPEVLQELSERRERRIRIPERLSYSVTYGSTLLPVSEPTYDQALTITAEQAAALQEQSAAMLRNEEAMRASQNMLESFRNGVNESASNDGTGVLPPQTTSTPNGNSELTLSNIARLMGMEA
jgi:hypothetical protein